MTQSTSHWRNIAAPIVRQVIADVGTDDRKTLRRALREAYPFGIRQFHPYRIWCDEIKRQISGQQHIRRPQPPPEAPGQTALFPTEP